MAHLSTAGDTLKEKLFDLVLSDDEPYACEVWPAGEDAISIRIALDKAKPVMIHLYGRDARHLRDLLVARFPVE
jgi:hypothetical protein